MTLHGRMTARQTNAVRYTIPILQTIHFLSNKILKDQQITQN